jgi:hypothetical protein
VKQTVHCCSVYVELVWNKSKNVWNMSMQQMAALTADYRTCSLLPGLTESVASAQKIRAVTFVMKILGYTLEGVVGTGWSWLRRGTGSGHL